MEERQRMSPCIISLAVVICGSILLQCLPSSEAAPAPVGVLAVLQLRRPASACNGTINGAGECMAGEDDMDMTVAAAAAAVEEFQLDSEMHRRILGEFSGIDKKVFTKDQSVCPGKGKPCTAPAPGGSKKCIYRDKNTNSRDKC